MLFSAIFLLSIATAWSECSASDKQLQHLRNVICVSLEGADACQSNATAESDWPSQAVYMHDMLRAIADPSTCLNTTVAQETVAWLDVTDPSHSVWWWTWLIFQPEYYEMPRKEGERIESPATLGRKCWAFAYLAQIWIQLKPALERVLPSSGLSLTSFIQAYDGAIPLTMDLCDKVTANCYVNASYDPSRNGTCPRSVREYVVGFYWENGGGGRGPLPREAVTYPFATFDQTPAFRDDVALAVNTTLNYIL